MTDSFFNPPPETRFNVINLGAGVQSSAMALMAAKGLIKPMPDFAVFADTQAEPKAIYAWLDWLEKQLPFPVIRVTAGSLIDESLKIRVKEKSKYGDGRTYLRRIIPVFAMSPSGEMTAALGRSCTADFKIKPIINRIKKECGISRGQTDVTVTQWIGISYDEMQRMKLPQHKWTQHRWPLIELKMRRSQCLDWMKANGYPEPPRSACYFCPFHSNEEWRRLQTEDAEHFQKAIDFENKIRALWVENNGGFRADIFLHRKCQPLSTIDFRSDEEKGQMDFDFQSECEGMCGL
jgi:hypothetical protein